MPGLSLIGELISGKIYLTDYLPKHTRFYWQLKHPFLVKLLGNLEDVVFGSPHKLFALIYYTVFIIFFVLALLGTYFPFLGQFKNGIELYPVLVSVQSVIGIIIFSLAIFISNTARTYSRNNGYMFNLLFLKESFIFPLVSIELMSLVNYLASIFFNVVPNLFHFLIPLLTIVGVLYSFYRVMIINLDSNSLMKRTARLAQELIHSGLLYKNSQKLRALNHIKNLQHIQSLIGHGRHKHISCTWIKPHKEGTLININLSALRRLDRHVKTLKASLPENKQQQFHVYVWANFSDLVSSSHPLMCVHGDTDILDQKFYRLVARVFIIKDINIEDNRLNALYGSLKEQMMTAIQNKEFTSIETLAFMYFKLARGYWHSLPAYQHDDHLWLKMAGLSSYTPLAKHFRDFAFKSIDTEDSHLFEELMHGFDDICYESVYYHDSDFFDAYLTYMVQTYQRACHRKVINRTVGFVILRMLDYSLRYVESTEKDIEKSEHYNPLESFYALIMRYYNELIHAAFKADDAKVLHQAIKQYQSMLSDLSNRDGHPPELATELAHNHRLIQQILEKPQTFNPAYRNDSLQEMESLSEYLMELKNRLSVRVH